MLTITSGIARFETLQLKNHAHPDFNHAIQDISLLTTKKPHRWWISLDFFLQAFQGRKFGSSREFSSRPLSKGLSVSGSLQSVCFRIRSETQKLQIASDLRFDIRLTNHNGTKLRGLEHSIIKGFWHPAPSRGWPPTPPEGVRTQKLVFVLASQMFLFYEVLCYRAILAWPTLHPQNLTQVWLGWLL